MTDIAMHGHGVRGMKRETLHSFNGIGDPGKFGVMFPNLLPLYADDDALFELAKAMRDQGAVGADPDPGGDNENIPAGYTYLGQFIDHDITLDTTPLEVHDPPFRHGPACLLPRRILGRGVTRSRNLETRLPERGRDCR